MPLIQTANSQVRIFFTDSLKKNWSKSVICLFLCANTGNTGAKDKMISNETAYGSTSFPNCHQSDFSFIVVNVYFFLYLQLVLSQSNVLTLVQQYLYSSTAQILGF